MKQHAYKRKHAANVKGKSKGEAKMQGKYKICEAEKNSEKVRCTRVKISLSGRGFQQNGMGGNNARVEW